MRLDVLCIVGREGHGVSAYAAPEGFVLEVDGAVVIENSFALAGDGDVIEADDIHVFLRGVVKRSRDGTLSLQDLTIGREVVEESHGLGILGFLSHINIIMWHQMF